MPNRNYIKGRAKEYKIIKEFKEKGFIAFRSAGSHSPIDVVAIDPVNRVIEFIQSKPDSMSVNARNKIVFDNMNLNGAFQARFVVR